MQPGLHEIDIGCVKLDDAEKPGPWIKKWIKTSQTEICFNKTFLDNRFVKLYTLNTKTETLNLEKKSKEIKTQYAFDKIILNKKF